MRKFFKIVAFIMAFTFIPLSFGCKEKGSVIDAYFFHTGVHIETHDFDITKSTETKLFSLFRSLESEFDINDKNSFTHRFNNANTNDTFTLSENGAEIFNTAIECFEFSNGLFNPTVYTLAELWQFAPTFPVKNFTPPTNQQIEVALNNVDFNGLVFNYTERTVQKLNPNAKLDLGGIVKGYAAEQAGKILLSAGHSSGYVNVGGSSLHLLSVNTLGISHPRSNGTILTVNAKNLKGVSVSTSGDYEKFYSLDGVRYSHIINPFTGKPSTTNVCSVTIIGVGGAFSDAITTASCLKEYDITNLEGSQLIVFLRSIISQNAGCSVYAVYDDGQTRQIITNKIKGEHFTLNDNSYTVIGI